MNESATTEESPVATPKTTSSKDEERFINPNASLLETCRINKEGYFKFRWRRQIDWNDNYTLYRDKVQLNRLTQRQSVNVPIMKATVKTLLKDVDDPPILYFTNLDNNDQAEVYYNEYWKHNAIENSLVIQDIVDKRQVMLFGRSFKFMNILNGQFFWEVVAPDDVLVDRYVNPADIDSARGICREHEYVPLSSLMTDPKLDNAAVRRLQEYLSTKAGLVKATENQLDWVEKQRKYASLGVIDTFAPILGETYVELNEWWMKVYNDETQEDEIKYMVVAEDMEVLFFADQNKYIGDTQDHFWRCHYPATTWGDEAERQDFWSDGVADPLRPLNKVANTYWSQRVENRTFKNFGMFFYNSSLGEEGFVPQTFVPEPFGMYPFPAGQGARIGDAIMPIPIPDIEDSDKDLQFILTMAQQVSGATTWSQGVEQEPGQQITLGEVNILLNTAKQRVKSMAVYYTESWEDFGLKFVKMLEATKDMIEPIIIHKKGKLTKKNYAKQISPKMWNSDNGYKVEVKMKGDQISEDADALQKLNYTKSLMPNNMALDTIIKKKSLEFADLSAGEIQEVLKEDEQASKMAMMNPNPANPTAPAGGMPGGAPGGQSMPAQPVQSAPAPQAPAMPAVA